MQPRLQFPTRQSESHLPAPELVNLPCTFWPQQALLCQAEDSHRVVLLLAVHIGPTGGLLRGLAGRGALDAIDTAGSCLSHDAKEEPIQTNVYSWQKTAPPLLLVFFLLSLSLSFASFLLLVLFLPPFSLSFSFLSAPECLQLSCVAAKLYRSQASS